MSNEIDNSIESFVSNKNDSQQKQNLVTGCIFEMFGTMILVTCISLTNAEISNGNYSTILGVSLVYFCCLVITTPISGGHLNPAITFGTWVGQLGGQKGGLVQFLFYFTA